MRLILTGATGVAGLNIYRAALSDPSVSAITLIIRREMPSWAVLPENAAEKTTAIIQADFETYTPEVASALAQNDACIWALGKSARGVSEADYTQLTHDYPMALAKALRDAGVGTNRNDGEPFRFVYVSGELADPTEKSSQMWARVKGRTEKDLATFCSEDPGMKAYSIRPAFFAPNKKYPEDAKNQRSAGANFFNRVVGPIFATFLPAYDTPIEELSSVALEIAKGRWPEIELVRNKKIRELAKELQGKSTS